MDLTGVLGDLLSKAPRESGTSNMPLTELKARALNQAEGNLDEVHCTKCHDKGYTAYVQDGILHTKECSCMAKRRSMRRARRSGLMDVLSAYRFSTFETPEEWQQTAKDTAMRFITEAAAGCWLMVSGTPGSGKTHLCTAVCGELIKAEQDVAYMLWREDGQRLKACANDKDEYNRIMRPYKTCDVLYIDDFLKGKVTDGDLNLAFDLLNARYIARKKRTIISSELTVQQILDIDEAIGSRIYERSRDYSIRTAAQNWRLR